MRWIFLLVLLLTSCVNRPISALPTQTEAAATSSPTKIIDTPTVIPTSTATVVPSSTPTKVPEMTSTLTPLPTKYADGRINCPGSVALMYHKIYEFPKEFATNRIDTDIVSFRKVIEFLFDHEYYFPTPEEFSSDIEDLVCERKYAIVTIDDSWNDPQTMGVVDVLISIRGGSLAPGLPKVWFGVITRRTVPYQTASGNSVDQWSHLKLLQNQDIVYVVSHSQTHPAELVDVNDVYGAVNDGVYGKIAEELGPSRADITKLIGNEPLFFIYPGGNVNQTVSSRLKINGYAGAFTVTPGGLDRSFPNYLPRINGGYGCDQTVEHNSECVISKIITFSGN